ncbi:hypothetical protein JCM19233_1928 [Vibrio astriarenae]|nr:hypothetical protein JCM19233_1928 [Vibrio sp. C7]
MRLCLPKEPAAPHQNERRDPHKPDLLIDRASGGSGAVFIIERVIIERVIILIHSQLLLTA